MLSPPSLPLFSFRSVLSKHMEAFMNCISKPAMKTKQSKTGQKLHKQQGNQRGVLNMFGKL